MKEAALAAEPSADGTKAKGKGRGGKGRGKGKKGRGRGKEQAKENKNKDVVEEKKDDEKENENKVEVDEVVPELPKEVEDPPPAIPTEPVPPVPAAKKRARSQKTAPNEGSASSGLPKSSKKIKNGKGEQTAEASHEGKGTQATKRKNKTKKTRDGDGVETKKKKHGASCEGGAATFARRVQPTSDFGKAKWLALRSMFATHIKPHLEHYSAHEDVYQFLCILFFFIIVKKKVKTKAFPFQGIHLSICSFYVFVFFLCPIKVLVLNR